MTNKENNEINQFNSSFSIQFLFLPLIRYPYLFFALLETFGRYLSPSRRHNMHKTRVVGKKRCRWTEQGHERFLKSLQDVSKFQKKRFRSVVSNFRCL